MGMDIKEVLQQGAREGKTLKEVGDQLGVTRERTRQLYRHYNVNRTKKSGKGIYKEPTINLELTELQLAWLAGLYEGEGCFSTSSNTNDTRVTLTMTDRDVVETAYRLLGCGYFLVEEKENDNHQTAYRLYLGGQNAVIAMLTLHPHMHSRRQARIEELLGTVPERVRQAKQHMAARKR